MWDSSRLCLWLLGVVLVGLGCVWVWGSVTWFLGFDVHVYVGVVCLGFGILVGWWRFCLGWVCLVFGFWILRLAFGD